MWNENSDKTQEPEIMGYFSKMNSILFIYYSNYLFLVVSGCHKVNIKILSDICLSRFIITTKKIVFLTKKLLTFLKFESI